MEELGTQCKVEPYTHYSDPEDDMRQLSLTKAPPPNREQTLCWYKRPCNQHTQKEVQRSNVEE
jgi:hypothetical protein